MRVPKFVFTIAVALWAGSIAFAQITVPFPTFVAGTTIDPDQMNSNFSTLSAQALNRTGGTVTGNIAVDSNITIDSADISDYLASGNLTATGTLSVTGTSTLTGAVTASGGGVYTNPELKNYRESKSAPSISTNTLTLDFANGNHFAVALNANITTLTFSNVPASGTAVGAVLLFTADGTVRTITWPASVKWAGASAPTMTGTNGKVDIVSLYTVDGGTTWYAVLGGQNF